MEEWLYRNILKIAIVISIPLWLAFLTQYISGQTLFAIFLTIGAGWFAIVSTLIVSEERERRKK